MKRIYIVLITLLICINACAPSQGAIQTAVAQTQAAIPTATPYPTYTIAPTNTPLPSATPTPTFAKWTVQQIEDALVAAGVEFVNPTPMTKDDYGLAPMSAKEAIHFLTPSLCSDCGGRLYSFANADDLALMQKYYTELGRQSAAFFSWVFVKDNILIQINGDYPEAKANQFKAVLDNLQ